LGVGLGGLGGLAYLGHLGLVGWVLNLFLFATHFCFPSANSNCTKMIEVEVDRRVNGKLKRVHNLDI
jgi:hypothetical protein